MSAYTLADIRSDVKLVVVPQGNDPYTNSFYDQRINDAIQDIVYELVLPEFEGSDTSVKLAQGIRSYSLTGFDPLLVLSVKDTTKDQVLFPMGRDEADLFDETEEGQPTRYYRYARTIEVYPLPASDYAGDTLRIRYIRKPQTLSSDSDTSPLPAHFDRAIREYAVAACLQDIGELTRAAVHFRIYRAILKSRGNLRGREMRFNPAPIRMGRY